MDLTSWRTGLRSTGEGEGCTSVSASGWVLGRIALSPFTERKRRNGYGIASVSDGTAKRSVRTKHKGPWYDYLSQEI